MRPFTFDAAFDEDSSQEEVFEYSGIKYLVDMAIEGYKQTNERVKRCISRTI